MIMCAYQCQNIFITKLYPRLRSRACQLSRILLLSYFKNQSVSSSNFIDSVQQFSRERVISGQIELPSYYNISKDVSDAMNDV